LDRKLAHSVPFSTKYTAHRSQAGRVLLFSSIGSIVVVFFLVALAGAYTPGYNHTSQYISELGAFGAQHELWVRYFGFVPAGVLLLLFCGMAFAVLNRSVALVLGLLGLALFASGYLVSIESAYS